MGGCQSKTSVHQVAVDNTTQVGGVGGPSSQSTPTNNHQQQQHEYKKQQLSSSQSRGDGVRYNSNNDTRAGRQLNQTGDSSGKKATDSRRNPRTGTTQPTSIPEGAQNGMQQQQGQQQMQPPHSSTQPRQYRQQQQHNQKHKTQHQQQQHKRRESDHGGDSSEGGGHHRRSSGSSRGGEKRRESKSKLGFSMVRARRSDDDSLVSSLKAPSRKRQSKHHISSTAEEPPASSLIQIVNETKWKSIWDTIGYSLLVDPTDVHSVLQEQMSKVMNRMSNQDLLFLQRRIRLVLKYQFLSKSKSDGAGGGINSNSGDTSNSHHLQINSHHKQPGKTHSATQKMMSRFITGGSSSHSNSYLQHNNRNLFGYFDNNGKKLDTKALLEKYHLLNEDVVRLIFTGCNDLLVVLNSNGNSHITDGKKVSTTSTSKRGGGGIYQSKAAVIDSNSQNNYNNNDSSSTTDGSYNKFWSMIEIESNNAVGRNLIQQHLYLNEEEKLETTSTNFDPIHCAYILMASFHSNNWDILQHLAVDTAKYANIDMDVNKQIQQEQEENSNVKSSPNRRKSNRNNRQHHQQQQASNNNIPPPPTFLPSLFALESMSKINSSSGGATDENSSSNKDNASDAMLQSLASAIPPPMLDNGGGVTVNNLTYIVSIGLHGTRIQRLHLLWYLLLPPAILKDFLYNHPSGCSLPTFLLEVNGTSDDDDDVILSLSSLVHYYYYSVGDNNIDSSDLFVPRRRQKSSGQQHQKDEGKRNGSSATSIDQSQQPTLSSFRVIDIISAVLYTRNRDGLNVSSRDKTNALGEKHTSIMNGSSHQGSSSTVDVSSPDQQQQPNGSSDTAAIKRNLSAGHLGIFTKRNRSNTNLNTIDQDGDDNNNNNDVDAANGTSNGQPINNNKCSKSIMDYLDEVRAGKKSSCYYTYYFDSVNSTIYDKSYEKFWNASKDIILNYKQQGHCNGAMPSSSPAIVISDEKADPTDNDTATQSNTEGSPNETFAAATTRWTIHNFAKWADDALDDTSIDAIFYRVFGAGVLPSPSMECSLVQQRWVEWQRAWKWSKIDGDELRDDDDFDDNEYGTIYDYLSQSVRNAITPNSSENDNKHISNTAILSKDSRVWGGLGGYDGGGGLGYGILYCIDKKWWDKWASYVGWAWEDIYDASAPSLSSSKHASKRPGNLSTEPLLERSNVSFVAGTFGSYELMKGGLRKNVDYVLVPPSVWDLLYELYGGGPPLPRMVLPPPKVPRDSSPHQEHRRPGQHRDRTLSTDSKQMEEEDIVANDTVNSVEVIHRSKPSSLFASPLGNKPLKIPEPITIATHPWIIHAHLCDAQQPYRRGDAGPMSIRLMATPDQPLWRLYAELTVRLPTHSLKASDKDGFGRARLWKRIDSSPTNTNKDSSMRYGPWVLLCKNRYAILPLISAQPHGHRSIKDDNVYSDLKRNWEAYADHSTVESIGLCNGSHIMLEFAVLNKDSVFAWPREAAAKAGRVRHLAEEDAKFRRLLKGVDENGNFLLNPPKLEGMSVDAMDQSGRWYQVEILQVDTNNNADANDGSDDEVMGGLERSNGQQQKKANGDNFSRQVRVDFSEYGGHVEWIDVDSDRLAKAGRFTIKSERDLTGSQRSSISSIPASAADVKKATQGGKKSNDVESSSGGKLCTFPGYGACGLANLGNTCYMNSAVQCISYFPLLRAYLISGRYRAYDDLNKDNPLGTGGKLLEEFAELLRVMWSGKYGERSPTRFRLQLGRARSQFSGADQQDAQELLNYMMDVLHEDSNRVKKKPYVEALEDDWVKKTSLPRVGQEAWRRFLRRNRSIMADIAHGQVLNTVKCPTCGHSSRIFDPFNLLSLPFPTVADVYFQCTVIRRASAFNCPQTLNRPRKGEKKKDRFERRKATTVKQPPSDQLVFEQYVIALSRLADVGDLRMQLQNVSGIPSNRLKLCKIDEVVVTKDVEDTDPVKSYFKVNALPDKEGPCLQVAKNSNSPDDVGTAPTAPTQVLALELTLNPRPKLLPKKNGRRTNGREEEDDEETADEYEEEDDDELADEDLLSTPREERALKELLEFYGDAQECRIYDSDPLLISKAISRRLWPKTESDFKLGLRVDAIDHRNHWFPGSVVEIIEGVAAEEKSESTKPNDQPTKAKVRIHFDNFSSKWDETYSIEHFLKRQVRPLYSHATPRVKPTEFLVHHRYYDKQSKTNRLFGQTFFIQCQNEWSTARAGAHILAQAARFLSKRRDDSKTVNIDEGENVAKVRKIYDRLFSTISELIDLLIDCDRQYVRLALGMPDDGSGRLSSHQAYGNFDSSALSTALIENVRNLLFKLPFEVRVCSADSPLGGGNNAKGSNSITSDEVPFPFSLMRAIGNFMNARHCVVLHWREPPVEKKNKAQPISYVASSVMYVKPEVTMHKASIALLNDHQAAKKSKNSPGSGGLHLGVCLSEFCKVNKLHLTDNWRCPRCKEFREGSQSMDLWKLPDLLTFHIKRFNCSARWREKISTKVNFPLTGLDMTEWCHKESPARQEGRDSCVYDLIGVLNHYGGMTGGHYVATCKATACSTDGSEEAAYDFNGVGASSSLINTIAGDDLELTGGNVQSGWRLGRSKDKEAATNQNKVAAMASSKAASESSEPLWLQFDDELVEPIPPRNVVSEMAYVLFYRRRRITPSNVAKYSTFE